MSDTASKPETRQDQAGSHQAGSLDDGARTGDKALKGNAQDKMSERLDEGLEETFPSSDPVSVKITK